MTAWSSSNGETPSDKMNILYITKTSILSDGGGGEERARQVTEGLASRGHEVTVLCGATDPDLPKWTSDSGRTIRHVSCVPSSLFRFPKLSFYATRYLFALFSLPVLFWLLLTREYDVLVENMTPYPSLSIIGSRVTGIPIVAVQHEFYDRSCYRTYDPLTATIQLVVQNILRVGTYTGVIVPTNHVARKLAEYGVEESRLAVVPNGVDADRYRLTDLERNQRYLITVGRLSKRKGQDTILEAFQEIHQRAQEVELHVIGDGPARSELEEYTETLGLSDAVTFHGYVESDEKIEMMNRAGIFVFASRQEGFGLVLLEAMASGLPVVATKLPVYDDFFQQDTNGRLLGTRDPESFAREVLELLNDSERVSDIRTRNREKAAEFSWDSTVDETENLLRQIKADDLMQ